MTAAVRRKVQAVGLTHREIVVVNNCGFMCTGSKHKQSQAKSSLSRHMMVASIFTSAHYLENVRILFVGCLPSQQHVSVSHGRIWLDKCTCCQTDIHVADQTFYLTQSQYTDTGPTSPSADHITPGFWQGNQWRANF